MQRKVDEPHGYGQGSLVSRFFRWLFFIFVALFAVAGLVAATLLIISWSITPNWTVADLLILIGKVARFTETHFVTGVTIAKGTLELLSLVLIAFAAFFATLRMPMLAGIIRDFITARGSIYTLQNTITDATKMVQSISGLEPIIRRASSSSSTK